MARPCRWSWSCPGAAPNPTTGPKAMCSGMPRPLGGSNGICWMTCCPRWKPVTRFVLPVNTARWRVCPSGGGQALNFGLAHLDVFAWVGGLRPGTQHQAPEELRPKPAEARGRLKLLWLGCGNKDGLLRISQRWHAYLKHHAAPHVWHVDDNSHDARAHGKATCTGLRSSSSVESPLQGRTAQGQLGLPDGNGALTRSRSPWEGWVSTPAGAPRRICFRCATSHCKGRPSDKRVSGARPRDPFGFIWGSMKRGFLRNLILLCATVSLGASHSPLELWYSRPAARWTDALPVGNGRLGAMVFGGLPMERLQLNEGTLWSGGPRDWNNPGAREVLPQVREALFAGDFVRAAVLCRKRQGSYNQSSQPLGNLWLTFPHAA